LNEVISDKQQQINRTPMNALENLFLEERAGHSDAKRLRPDNDIIGCGPKVY